MKNKKGFTLVELLAVVVILGVLLLIAVPAVRNLINSSKKRSFESTAKLAIENVETLASFEVQEKDTITACYVPLSSISLSRGTYGTNAHGFVLVSSTGIGTINYSNSGFSTSGTILGGFTTYPASDTATGHYTTYGDQPAENADADTTNDIPVCNF